jgi:hypothetical protein
LRQHACGAIELVYDNYNALAIGFGATERASDVIMSVAVFPRWVSIFFMQGTKLPDPARILKGGGKRVRHVAIKEASELEAPALHALMIQALARAPKPLDPEASRRLVIKSISPTQRPRRPVPRSAATTPRRVERLAKK